MARPDSSPANSIALTLIALLSGGHLLHAEESTAPKAPASAERMTITGSRIKRIDIEQATPTKVLTQDDFQKAGITSVSELLKSQTENTLGSFNGGGGYVAVGQATLNLHGLGAGRTLVLVNGRRLPAEASLGGTNINNIPLAMVEKVEVVKSSASAVYGADAVAGVINVILKKAVTGTELATEANISQEAGGNSLKASAVTGFQVAEADVTLAAGMGKSERILTKNRSQLWQAVSPYDKSSAGAPAGTYSWGLLNPAKPSSNLLEYTFQPSANCPVENQIAFPNDATNTYCRGDARKVDTGELMPEKQDRFVALNAEKSFGDIQANATLLASGVNTSGYSRSRTLTSNPARAGYYALPYGSAPESLKAQAVAAGKSYQADQLIKIVGPSLFPEYKGNTRTSDSSLGGMLSLKGSLATDWEWNFDVSHFTTKRVKNFAKAPDSLAFVKNLFPVDVNEAPKLNIFQDDTSVISGYFADLHSEEVNQITSATWFASGPIYQLPEGRKVSVAAGVSAAHENYILRGDSKDSQFLNQYPETSSIFRARYLGSFAADGHGSRDVSSAFAEFDLPFSKQVDLSLAGRYDQYSDFGGTFNYGTSLVYAPASFLKLRANAGSGFKAPTLAQLFNQSDGGYLSVKDSKYCDNSVAADNPCGPDGETYRVYVNSPGNGKLKEETSLAYNFGVVFQPIDAFNVSVDYWSANIKGVIGQEDLDRLIEKEIRGESVAPSTITRGPDNRIASIQSSYANLGTLRSQGIDAVADFSTKLDGFTYGYRNAYSLIISQKSKDTISDPEKENIGSYRAPRYRMTQTLSFQTSQHNVSLAASTVGRQESARFETDPSFGYIAPETQYDLSYGWSYSAKGSLHLGVANLLNKIGGVHLYNRDTRVVTYPADLADVRGRQLQIGLRQAF